MKRITIAGILALVSTLWAIAISAYVELNLVENWMNFRFFETALQRGVFFPLLLSLVILAVSTVYLIAAFFGKNGK